MLARPLRYDCSLCDTGCILDTEYCGIPCGTNDVDQKFEWFVEQPVTVTRQRGVACCPALASLVLGVAEPILEPRRIIIEIDLVAIAPQRNRADCDAKIAWVVVDPHTHWNASA